MSPTKRRVQFIILGILGLIFLAAGIGRWWMAVGRWPLRGDLSHDFGEIVMSERPIHLEHTFELRNRMDETIVVEAVRPSCGCLSAQLSDETIEPGQRVTLDATMTLTWPGKRQKTQIDLILQDLGVQTLHLSGKGLDDPDWKPLPKPEKGEAE